MITFFGIVFFVLTIACAIFFEKLCFKKEGWDPIPFIIVLLLGLFFGFGTLGFLLSAGNDGSVIQEIRLKDGEVYRTVANLHYQDSLIVILLDEKSRLIGCKMDDTPPKIFKKEKGGEYVPFVEIDATKK